MRNWKYLSLRIVEHGQTKNHIEAHAILELWKKNEVIDEALEDRIRFEASFWKMVLERLCRITLLLAKNSLPFRGHQESLQDEYNGNFLSQVKFLANYDNVMKQVIEMPSSYRIRYLSPKIQNEIIECLSEKLLSDLIANINSSPFFLFY